MKEKINKLKEILIKYKKFIIIFVVLIISIIVGINIIKNIEEKNFIKNKNNLPDIEMVSNNAKSYIENNVSSIKINDEKISDFDYAKGVFENIEYVDQSDMGVTVKVNYKYDGNYNFEVPLEMYYSFDGKVYTLDNIYDHYTGSIVQNLRLSHCDFILKNKEGYTYEDIINNDYKDKYDSIEFTSKELNMNECLITYTGIKNSTYINKADTITIRYYLNGKSNTEFELNSSELTSKKDIKFNLVGDYQSYYEAKGYYTTHNKLSFGIESVDGYIIKLKSGGYQGEQSKVNKGVGYRYNIIDDTVSIEESDYDYYNVKVKTRYGTNGASGSFTFRIYEDKLLFYCSYPSQKRTDGCKEITKK